MLSWFLAPSFFAFLSVTRSLPLSYSLYPPSFSLSFSLPLFSHPITHLSLAHTHTRPVGIASVWDRAACKLALSSTGLNAKTACGSKQLCAGLEAGIEGAVQAVLKKSTADGGMQFGEEETDAATPAQPAAAADDGVIEGHDTENWTADDWTRLFTQPGQEELDATADDAGEEQANILLLVDAANGFNNLSWLAML